MNEFVKLLVAFVSGGILTPYFSHFLLIKKTRQELRLKYLEETYELTKQFNNYVAQILSITIFSIAFIEQKIDKNGFPKSIESPINRLTTLLDYHLSAEPHLIYRLEALNIEVIGTARPIAEAINNPNRKRDFFTNAVSLAIEATEKGPTLTNEIIQWIKEEKRKIESDPTPFHIVYWKNLWIKSRKTIQKSFYKCEGK